MTQENNLDEDILQCRAEILRALGKPDEDGKEDGKSEATDKPENKNPDNSDLENTVLRPEQDPVETEAPLSEQSLTENWIDQTLSNSGSFENISLPDKEDPINSDSANGSTDFSAEKEEQENPSSPAENHPPIAEQTSLSLPKAIESLKKRLRILKKQKENLSQTCQEQEKHIARLTDEIQNLQQQLQQAQQTNADFSARIAHLQSSQELAEQLKTQLEQTQHDLEQLRGRILSLEQQNARLAEENSKLTQTFELERQHKQAYEREQTAMQEEMNILKKKNDELQQTVALLNQENEHLRQEKSSLQQQVHLLQQGIARQQTDFQKTTASLREELNTKTEQIEYWKAEYTRLSERSAFIQTEPEPQDFLPDEIPAQPEESAFSDSKKSAEEQLKPAEIFSRPTKTDFSIPSFNLSEQILFAQRKINGTRRQSPSNNTANFNESLRQVVRQFVSTPQPPSTPKPAVAKEPSQPTPQPKPIPAPPAQTAPESLISEIVRRDIEEFCRNHQWVYVEFPSG